MNEGILISRLKNGDGMIGIAQHGVDFRHRLFLGPQGSEVSWPCFCPSLIADASPRPASVTGLVNALRITTPVTDHLAPWTWD